MITKAAEVAHSLASTPESRRHEQVNVALNELDAMLKADPRAYSTYLHEAVEALVKVGAA